MISNEPVDKPIPMGYGKDGLMKQKIDDIVEKIEEIMEWGGTAKDITLLVISALALLISIFHLVPGLPFDAAWVAIILCGIPIIMEAVIGLVTAFDIKADVLVSLALIASVCIHEDFAAGEVAFIMQLGALLEGLTVARARAGIEKLVHLTPTTARRLVNGAEEVIAAEKVRVGDILKVLPGETVPVDGVILQGQTSINQAVIGNATKHGFLVREGDALERLAGVKRVTFDKTGTLTVGVPKVSMVKSLTQDYTDQELYALTAAAEKNSEHPLGKAIVNCFRKEAGGELMAVWEAILP